MRKKIKYIPRKKRKRFFPKFVALLVMAGIVMIIGWRWLSSAMDRPYKLAAAKKTITIEPGSNTSEIISRLFQEGILESELPVKLWVRYFGSGKQFKAGDYEFKSPISPRQVITKLIQGSVTTHPFTIPEGYNHFDIATMIANLDGLKEPPKSPGDVLAMLRKVSLIEDLDPEAKDLEGYLFPDTYDYTASTTREKLIEVMVKRFRQVYTTEL